MGLKRGQGFTVAAAEREGERLRAAYPGVVERLFEIAERKISVLDEYGDESWDALPRLVAECIGKIAARERGPRKTTREWTRAVESPATTTWLGAEELPYVALALVLVTEFRNRHELRRAQPRNVDDLNDLSGAEFEVYVARLLSQKGFSRVRATPSSGDQGADLMAERDGRLFVIQVKRSRRPVGNRAVQEVAAAVTFYGGDEGWVMSNSDFTRAAKVLAHSAGIKLAVVRGRRPRA